MFLASTDGGSGVVDSACPAVVFVVRETVVVKASSPGEHSVLLVIFRVVLDLHRVVRICCLRGFLDLW